MSRATDDMPERLRVDGSDFERRLLDAVAHEEPSAELSQRMAAAVGISAAVIGSVAGGAAAAKAASEVAAAAKAAAGKAGVTLLWPWISAGVVVLAIAGAVVGTRASKTSERPPRSSPPAVERPAAPATPLEADKPVPSEQSESPSNATAAAPSRRRSAGASVDLGDQIAIMDSARAAVTAGTAERALELLRRYQEKYPAGSFRPEAGALRIEALVKLGRNAEARSLAERFVSEHKVSPLADRVARIAGLNRP